MEQLFLPPTIPIKINVTSIFLNYYSYIVLQIHDIKLKQLMAVRLNEEKIKGKRGKQNLQSSLF